MVDVKLVLGTAEGKTYQKEIKSPEADRLHGKKVGDTVTGEEFGFPGYEFLITGGSDKAGFPMRKGIQTPRKVILTAGGVGYSGKDRNKSRQKGIIVSKTVCGERITSSIHQVNMKVLKAGSQPLGGAVAAESAKAEQ